MDNTHDTQMSGMVYMPSIGKLAAALAKAQGEIKGAAKDKDNPFFKSKYADLNAVWSACRAALSKNGLAVIQATFVTPEGMFLRTTLAHESGETTEGVWPIRPVKDDPQGIGSATTYARRFSLAAMVGVAPENEDDDGNAASAGTPGPTKDKSPPAQIATNGKAKSWVDGEIKKIDGFNHIAEIDNWKEDMAKALTKLQTTATEEYNRLVSYTHQKIEALGGNVEDGIRHG